MQRTGLLLNTMLGSRNNLRPNRRSCNLLSLHTEYNIGYHKGHMNLGPESNCLEYHKYCMLLGSSSLGSSKLYKVCTSQRFYLGNSSWRSRIYRRSLRIYSLGSLQGHNSCIGHLLWQLRSNRTQYCKHCTDQGLNRWRSWGLSKYRRDWL